MNNVKERKNVTEKTRFRNTVLYYEAIFFPPYPETKTLRRTAYMLRHL